MPRKKKPLPVGCRAPLLRAELEDLVGSFVNADDWLFADFKRVWKEKKFSMIHHSTQESTRTSRPADVLQHVFANILRKS
jgi:hypothetical protein